MATAEQTDNVTEYCEACGGIEAHEVKVAAVYCVECQQRLCRDCEEDHKKFKVTRRHLTAELRNQAFSQQRPLSTCEKHPDEYLEIYCFDCKKPICVMCRISLLHNKHKCSDVNQIADEFREQMASDVGKIDAGGDICREMLAKIKKEKNDFNEQLAKAEKEIGKKAEQLKQAIDDHKEKLIKKLSSMKQERMKEIESLRKKLKKRHLSMKRYKKYVDEVRQKRACDIVTAASDLHDRADELLKFDVIERELDDLGHADVTFTSSDIVIDDVNKALRHLRLSTAKTGLI